MLHYLPLFFERLGSHNFADVLPPVKATLFLMMSHLRSSVCLRITAEQRQNTIALPINLS